MSYALVIDNMSAGDIASIGGWFSVIECLDNYKGYDELKKFIDAGETTNPSEVRTEIVKFLSTSNVPNDVRDILSHVASKLKLAKSTAVITD